MRLIMARKDLNTSGLGRAIEIDQSSASKAVRGISRPNRASLRLLLDLAETDEEREPILRALGRTEEADQAAARLDVVGRLLRVLGEGKSEDIAVAVGGIDEAFSMVEENPADEAETLGETHAR